MERMKTRRDEFFVLYDTPLSSVFRNVTSSYHTIFELYTSAANSEGFFARTICVSKF